MNINFKAGCFNFNVFFTKSNWTKSSESMDNVQWVHGLSGLCLWILPSPPGLVWTMSRLSTESMDNVHWIKSGWSHWTLSMDSLDFVQSVHGLSIDGCFSCANYLKFTPVPDISKKGQMSVTSKPVLGVCNQGRLKLVCSATETS